MFGFSRAYLEAVIISKISMDHVVHQRGTDTSKELGVIVTVLLVTFPPVTEMS